MTAPAITAIRTRRYLAAVIVPIPAASIALGQLFSTDGPNTRTTLDLIAANPDRQVIFAVLGYLGLLTAVPALLGAAQLCRRRRPVMTIMALVVNHAAFLGAFGMSAIDNLYLVGGLLPVDQRGAAASVIDRMRSTDLAGLSTDLFVFGHIVGAVLMGLALRGSIATVGWMAMLLTTPAHVIAVVVLQTPGVDMVAWLLMAVGFGYCAAAIIKSPDDHRPA